MDGLGFGIFGNCDERGEANRNIAMSILQYIVFDLEAINIGSLRFEFVRRRLLFFTGVVLSTARIVIVVTCFKFRRWTALDSIALLLAGLIL
jgi:hypothetical protein